MKTVSNEDVYYATLERINALMDEIYGIATRPVRIYDNPKPRKIARPEGTCVDCGGVVEHTVNCGAVST